MTAQPRISLIFPAYNEAASIANTIEQAVAYFSSRRISYEIIVSADGEDGTREKVREMAGNNASLRVIGENARRGKGLGIREAVAIATGEIIGFADADNKVPVEEIDKILPELSAGYEVVIGSRALAKSQLDRRQPLYRHVGGKAFRIVMRSITGLYGVNDSQCGFKFFPRDVARRLFTLQRVNGYMFDVEILLLAHKLGYRIREVPIRWRDDGDSRLNVISGNLKNARDILRIRYMHRDLGRNGDKSV